MKIAEHIAKAKRFEATIQKLDLDSDYEVINWARMHACSHFLNGALHARSITPEEWDIRHTWYLEDYPDQAQLAAKLDDEFRQALWSLTVFEGLRQTHVRGQGPYGPEITAISTRAFDHIKNFCIRVMDIEG